jgi:hypothetical protein
MREYCVNFGAPMLRATATIVSLALVSACASPGIPPGGPVDTEGPTVVSSSPDSGKTGVMPDEVVFRFDEVVSERPSGAASLDGLFVISPREGTPNVDWHRSEITVKPRRGWRRNVTYTVSMLPGITDLRGNIRNTGKTIIFSTGSSLGTGTISGRVFNWSAGAPAPRAVVEARSTTDTSLVFVAIADSTGGYVLANLGPASYRLRGIIDENQNRGLDRREPWDTATVVLTDTAQQELLAFVHDSIAARLSSVVVRDSMTLELMLDSPVDPSQQLRTANVTVTASDSTRFPVASVTRSPVDTAGGLGFKPTRPPPARSLLVKLGAPIRTAGDFRVRAIELRSLEGTPSTSERVVRLGPITQAPATPVPTPPPPPPAAAAPIKR